MKQVLFTKKSKEKISLYFANYKKYYIELYEDSWIWSKDLIVKNYL